MTEPTMSRFTHFGAGSLKKSPEWKRSKSPNQVTQSKPHAKPSCPSAARYAENPHCAVSVTLGSNNSAHVNRCASFASNRTGVAPNAESVSLEPSSSGSCVEFDSSDNCDAFMD